MLALSELSELWPVASWILGLFADLMHEMTGHVPNSGSMSITDAPFGCRLSHSTDHEAELSRGSMVSTGRGFVEIYSLGPESADAENENSDTHLENYLSSRYPDETSMQRLEWPPRNKDLDSDFDVIFQNSLVDFVSSDMDLDLQDSVRDFEYQE